MVKKLPGKATLPVKVNFLSERDQGPQEIPIFVTRAPKNLHKKPTTIIKKTQNDS
jgi:hypothetical protein